MLGIGAGDDGGGGYKVRAIFDNVASAVEGEDVKIAGAQVGAIDTLDVTEDNKAAVVLQIDEPGFSDFREDASCTIRPQSLIGEKFVECTPTAAPTQPRRARGDRRTARTGEGQHLLPRRAHHSPVDIDLINNILRLPYRQRLAIIINELGTGAGRPRRGPQRGDPARQPGAAARPTRCSDPRPPEPVLADLATDSDAALAPLARERAHVADFIVQANGPPRRRPSARAELERRLREAAALPARAAADDGRPRALSPTRPRPCSRDLGAPRRTSTASSRSSGRSRRLAPALDSRSATRRRSGGPALQRAEPMIEDLRDSPTDAGPLARPRRAR